MLLPLMKRVVAAKGVWKVLTHSEYVNRCQDLRDTGKERREVWSIDAEGLVLRSKSIGHVRWRKELAPEEKLGDGAAQR